MVLCDANKCCVLGWDKIMAAPCLVCWACRGSILPGDGNYLQALWWRRGQWECAWWFHWKIQLWPLELGMHKGKHYPKQELPVCLSAVLCTNAAIKPLWWQPNLMNTGTKLTCLSCGLCVLLVLELQVLLSIPVAGENIFLWGGNAILECFYPGSDDCMEGEAEMAGGRCQQSTSGTPGCAVGEFFDSQTPCRVIPLVFTCQELSWCLPGIWCPRSCAQRAILCPGNEGMKGGAVVLLQCVVVSAGTSRFYGF